MIVALETCKAAVRPPSGTGQKTLIAYRADEPTARIKGAANPDRRDPSVFADERQAVRINPDLNLEDLLTDVRPDACTRPPRRHPPRAAPPCPCPAKAAPAGLGRRQAGGLGALAGLLGVAACVAAVLYLKPWDRLGEAGAGTDPAGPVIQRASNAEPPIVPLFNGKDIDDWAISAGGDRGHWKAEDGQIVGLGTGDPARQSYLLSKTEFEDFLLRLEVKLPPKTDSGIGLWGMPGEADSPVEINLRNFDEASARMASLRTTRSGRPQDYAPPDSPPELKPADEWNAVEVESIGGKLRVRFNGKDVIQRRDLGPLAGADNALPAVKRRKGRIGLQVHTGVIRFRNIEARDLSGPGVKPEAPAYATLFGGDGKNLVGWVARNADGSSSVSKYWEVKDGILHGQGGRSHLYSPRADYKDVRVRAEMKVNAVGNTGLLIRAGDAASTPNGYEAEVRRPLTGSIYTADGYLTEVDAGPIPPDTWFTLEAEAVDNRIRVWVNGKLLSDYIDKARRFRTGAIALEVGVDSTHVQIRKLEVMDLSEGGPAATASKPTPAAGPPYTTLLGGKSGGVKGWTAQTNGTKSSDPAEWKRWTLKDGILEGRSGLTHLFSPRNDYVDVRVRAEVKINAGGDSGLYVRAGEGSRFPDGYEAQICCGTAAGPKTGSIYQDIQKVAVEVDPSPVPPDTWFTLEVEVIDNRIKVSVDGKVVAQYEDKAYRCKSGAIALQVLTEKTIVQFRKIEVLELSGSAPLDRGLELVREKKYAEAIPALREAIRREPRNAQAHQALINALRSDNRVDAAIEAWQAFLEVSRTAQKYLSFASYLYQNGRKREAAEAAREAVRIQPTLHEGYSILGLALSNLKDRAGSIDAHRKGLMAEPNCANCRNNLAWTLAGEPDPARRQANLPEALRLAREAVQLKPNEWANQHTLGAVEYRSGNLDAAAAAMQKSMDSRQGGDANEWVYLAMIAHKKGDTPGAISWLAKTQEWMRARKPGRSSTTTSRRPRPRPLPCSPAASAEPGPPPAPKPPEPPARKSVTNAIGMKLILIEPGEFDMGAPPSDRAAGAAEKPRHKVKITRAFYLGETEVTRAQYRKLRDKDPSKFRDDDNLPVEQVTWFEAASYCNALSVRDKLEPYYLIEGNRVTTQGRLSEGYRLPTEAEWEYACLAGSVMPYSFGARAADLGDYAWFNGNSGERTHPVAGKKPNAWGLFDMHGNVWEWVGDRFDANYYAQSPASDPAGPVRPGNHLFRGGSWMRDAGLARATARYEMSPDFRGTDIGFRVARNAPARPAGR
ncbi:MAG: family 16 glycoside hydrolase [Isosphaeraceae bacterium]